MSRAGAAPDARHHGHRPARSPTAACTNGSRHRAAGRDKELADTFDSMLDRLDRAFDGQRRFVANASHELRTPLAINRTLVEVALGRPTRQPEMRQLGATLLEVNARHERLIDGLLVLAESEHALSRPARWTWPTSAPISSSRRRRIGEASLEAADMAGDPVLLERLVLNLRGERGTLQRSRREDRRRDSSSGGNCLLTVAQYRPVVAAYESPAVRTVPATGR